MTNLHLVRLPEATGGHDEGDVTMLDRGPIEAALDDWALWMRATGAGAHRTVKARQQTVQQFARHAHIDPRDLTPQQVLAFVGRQGLSRNTRTTYYGHLRSWARWLEESGQVDRDPMLRMRRPKPGRGVPRPIPADVAADALERATDRTRAYMLLALYAGLRVHEIAKVRGGDVGPDVFTVLGKGQQLWQVPTHPVLWDLAQQMPLHGWWFPGASRYGHVRGETVSTIVARHLRRCGYPGTAHQLRHSFGTEVLRSSGGNLRIAQELLRHSSPATTAVYTRVDDTERRAAVLALPGWAA